MTGHAKGVSQAALFSLTWKTHVVPTNQLWKELVRLVKPLIEQEMSKSLSGQVIQPSSPDGTLWLDALAARTSAAKGIVPTQTSIRRRLSLIRSGDQRVVSAELADAMFLTVGLRMDYDTRVQTFPGNLTHAYEMVEIRRPKWTPDEIEAGARRLITYRNRVLYPDGHKSLQTRDPRTGWVRESVLSKRRRQRSNEYRIANAKRQAARRARLRDAAPTEAA